MKHIRKEGSNNKLIILLHGTGGDSASMLGLADAVDPEAHVLGIDGDVFENGLRRYFARYADGSFDEESLEKATEELYQTIETLREQYGLTDCRVALMGYSNGANLAVHLFKRYETDYRYGILLHPSAGLADVPFKPQPDFTVLITSGNNDPYISPDEFSRLEKSFREAGISVETVIHERGHSLTHLELDKAGQILSAT